MKKKYILGTLIVMILAIPVILYFMGKFEFSDKNTFLMRWENKIEIPKDAKIQEIFSDVGSFGEGKRLIKLTLNSNEPNNSIFDTKNKKNNLSIIDKEFVRNIINQSKTNIDVEKLKFVKTLDKDGDNLIITYNEDENIFYLFEKIV